MSNLKEFGLKEVFEFCNGKSSKGIQEGEFLTYGSNGIIGTSEKSNYENAIILGRVGAYCGSVMKCANEFWATDNTIVLKPRNNFDLTFLYYHLLKVPLRSFAGGAAQPLITHGILSGIKIKLPPLPTQKRIADILSAYDDLIENNNRRIAQLEQSARHLYKEWFVRFKFPGHEKVKVVDGVPEGWERKTLGEVCDDKRQSILPDQIEPGTPYIGLEHIPKRQMVLNEWGNSDSISSMKFVYSKGDILFGKIRPYFHKVGFTFNNGVTSSDAIVICPSEPIYYSFVLCLVSSDEFVKLATQTMKEGSKMPRADWKSLKRDHIVPVPKAGLLNAFNHFIEPTLKQLETISLENVQLKATRDILLPKLLNGNMVT